MSENKRHVAGVIVISGDGLILLGKNKLGAKYGGLWQAPGGGVKEGEEPVDTARRELHEETGLIAGKEVLKLIDQDDVVTFEDPKHDVVTMIINMFRLELDSPAKDIKLLNGSGEFEILRWFSNVELNREQLVPAGIRLLDKLGFLRSI